ncbi:hypothetical protein ALISP_2966 [Alicycliphilus sp. B1]|nr:hypothetical protein ALISP_2966 [Alicycliphilus sp. B1]
MTAASYPLPRPDAYTQPYWDGAAAGELRYQRCAACGHVQLIPRSLCEQCHGSRLDWQVSQRTGTVLTFTTVLPSALACIQEHGALRDRHRGHG